MGAAAHLGIDLTRYDRRIRQFIPGYDAMLDAAAAAAASVVGRGSPLLDLGIGTGALAARCLAQTQRLRIVGIDADRAMLEQARNRLGSRPRLIAADFTRAALPRAAVIVSALALHHVAGTRRKLALYRACRAALLEGGPLVHADCCPAAAPALARRQFAAWRAHMLRSFPDRQVAQFFAAWAREDHYLPLPVELRLLRRAGFAPEIVWRQGCFAVIAALKSVPGLNSSTAAEPD